MNSPVDAKPEFQSALAVKAVSPGQATALFAAGGAGAAAAMPVDDGAGSAVGHKRPRGGAGGQNIEDRDEAATALAELASLGLRLPSHKRPRMGESPAEIAKRFRLSEGVVDFADTGAAVKPGKPTKRVRFADDIEIEFDAPGQGSCLYYAVAMAYLLPNLTSNTLFKKACIDLFGAISVSEIAALSHSLSNYNGNVEFIEKLAQLKDLIEKNFRARIADYILANRDEYFALMLGVPGTFPESVHDEESFNKYIADIRKPLFWGGGPEMRVIQALLKVRLHIVRVEDGFYVEHSPVDLTNDNPILKLVYMGDVHYGFIIPEKYVLKRGAKDAIDSKIYNDLISALKDGVLNLKPEHFEEIHARAEYGMLNPEIFATEEFYNLFYATLSALSADKVAHQAMLYELLAMAGWLSTSEKVMRVLNKKALCQMVASLIEAGNLTREQFNIRVLVLKLLEDNPEHLENLSIAMVHDSLLWVFNGSQEYKDFALGCLERLFLFPEYNPAHQILLNIGGVQSTLMKEWAAAIEKCSGAEPTILDIFTAENPEQYFREPRERRLLENAFRSYGSTELMEKLCTMIMHILETDKSAFDDFSPYLNYAVLWAALSLKLPEQRAALRIILMWAEIEGRINLLNTPDMRARIGALAVSEDEDIELVGRVLSLLPEPEAPVPAVASVFKPAANGAGGADQDAVSGVKPCGV